MGASYELVVFDWDGTLMDSEARIVTCMQLAARDCGIAVPDRAAARDIIGLGLEEAVQRLFPALDRSGVAALTDAYRAHWLGDAVDAAPMFAGARELIESLHRQGRLLAVATGKSRRGLDRALQESGLGGFFHASRCADEAFSKPHPQMLQDILTDLDTAPGAALVVGDTEYDMQMASAAGVDAVGVGHGVHAAERLLSEGALTCFDDLFALAEWLQQAVVREGTGV
ncbi:MAG: HAD-IA family hydrolase [Chromatiaceae bacterium]|nr:HAD-IA family hydrolase [Gammaproteobacteria bacterium]MCP5315680.1 HAD-IA family hydrolase [Chromatiaceae bacterium]